MIGKTHDKIASIEHPGLLKYKLNYDSSRHNSIFHIPMISFIGALKFDLIYRNIFIQTSMLMKWKILYLLLASFFKWDLIIWREP